MALVTYTRLGYNARRLYWELVSHPNIQLLAVMNEASGAVLDRCVRNRLSGTVTGSPTRGVALSNGFVGIAFDRSDDYINFGRQEWANFTKGGDHSIFCAIDPNQTTAVGFIASQFDMGGPTQGWRYGLDATNHIHVDNWLDDGGTRHTASGASALSSGTKYPIGFTYSNGVILGYTNGVAETLVAAGGGTDMTTGSSIPLNIGGCENGSALLAANGLSMVAVFNAVLTPNEIRRYAWLGGFL